MGKPDAPQPGGAQHVPDSTFLLFAEDGKLQSSLGEHTVQWKSPEICWSRAFIMHRLFLCV